MYALILFTFAFANPEIATWPQWRGPNRDGFVAKSDVWPETFSNFKEVWKVTDLGPSYSGPIVSKDAVFTTETRDKKSEVVTAYDRATGKPKWTQKWDGSLSVPFFAAANGSWIRSTPAFDGESLFVAGIRDKLVCLNAASGEIRWSLDCMKEFNAAAPDFGCVCSPLVVGNAVYIQAGAGFLKIDKANGKVLWRKLVDAGGMMGSAFSSPVLTKFGDTSALLVQTRSKLAAVNPDSGETLFEKEIPSFRGMNILTPIPFGDTVFTSTYGGTTQLIKITPSAAGLNADEAWKFKYEGNMTSPVVIGDHAYLLGKDQRFVCVSLKDGKQTWRSDKSYGKYWSLVANGDRILALDQRGVLYLIKANPQEQEILAEKKLTTTDTWAHLAVVGDEVIIRDLNGLTVYKWNK